MKGKQDIIPAVIPKSLADLKENLAAVSGFAHEVQVDIVDGQFVPFTSWPYGGGEQIADLTPLARAFDIEVDLMVKNPEAVLPEYVAAGAKRAVVHIESVTDVDTLLAHRKAHEYALGLSLNNDTPLEAIISYLDRVDFVQCMGIAQIGAQGARFDERVLERISTLRETNGMLEISVDGSVNEATLQKLFAAGANRFAVGSAILAADNPEAAFTHLSELIASYKQQ